MKRIEMIDCVGRKYLSANLETGEYSYVKALNEKIQGHKYLDIRFYDDKSNVAVLIEAKQNFKISDKQQLFDYVGLEHRLSPL